jgi:KDO2-lipid IV(A) lauroyltransferase
MSLRPAVHGRRILSALEAGPIYALLGSLRLLPADTAANAMAALARSVGPRLPISRVARRNLELSLPECSTSGRERILRAMWDNLGRVAAEFVHRAALADAALHEKMGGIDVHALRSAASPVTLRGERIELAGLENYAQLAAHRGPALIFAAHMGNWELLHWLAERASMRLAVVYRRPNNPLIARLVEGPRGGTVEFLAKGMAGAFGAARVMEQGGRLGFLADVKENRGIPVPFFGRPAMTGTTLAKFALRYNAPLFGAHVERLGRRARFRVIVDPPIFAAATGDEEADVRTVMTAVNARIESWIRGCPEQWLWLHRRWPRDGSAGLTNSVRQ